MIKSATAIGHRFIPARAGNTFRAHAARAQGTVHPRSRGEHPPPTRNTSCESGSSPLARGTPVVALGDGGEHRFIPARAGNTSTKTLLPAIPAVHPRSRGEHTRRASPSSSRTGSSPLARGTLPAHRREPVPDRFIPARAGNTIWKAMMRTPSTVHPRSRGEHRRCQHSAVSCSGSSPLARGTLIKRATVSDIARFIPARAGNTVRAPPANSDQAVHPRSRGEHSRSEAGRRAPDGSSPLARGTRDFATADLGERRFIPARAGNTPSASRRGATASVHPRSRGEHPVSRASCLRFGGSSPLARGTPGETMMKTKALRFIPARAGNTRGRPGSASGPPVHPRSRGEHHPEPWNHLPFLGSSPLARGTRLPLHRPREPQRFIPARAGNTGG